MCYLYNIWRELSRLIYNIEMNIKNYIKSLLKLNAITIKKMAQLMTEKSERVYTAGSLSNKINREGITLKEAYILADILGYKIEFIKKD